MTEQEKRDWQMLSDSYSFLKCRFQMLKEECIDKGKKNAILNDKYLEVLRKLKDMEIKLGITQNDRI